MMHAHICRVVTSVIWSRLPAIALMLLLVVAGRLLRAGDFNPDGINGTLIICGGGELPEQVNKSFHDFLKRDNDEASSDSGTLLVVPFAGNDHSKSFESAKS